jgi:flagellin
MFSINTNLGAQAALQSLAATNTALTQTQNEVSTGLKVSSAADNPAVYAISQAMDGTIAGLSAVSDGLSFAAQVVNTASTASSSISSTLSTLKQTVTQGQQQGLTAAQMNSSIASALTQIDTFANSATMNGVNLISGAVGAQVQNTNMNVLSDTNGDSFTVGGTGAAALNATSAGLGLSGLTVSATGNQFALGGAGMVFTSTAAAAAVTAGDVGATATDGTLQIASQTVTLQNTNYDSTAATSQSSGQRWVFVMDDGSTAATTAVTTAQTAAQTAQTTATMPTTNPSGSTSIGNGNTIYSYTTGADGSNNPTQIYNVVDVKVSAGESQANQAAQLTALTQAMNSVGFNATVDNSNNLSISGNNISSTATTTINNFTTAGAAGTAPTATPQTDATTAIARVTAAITALGNISTALGNSSNQIAGMASFTSSLSNALTAGVGALTDADLATESAKLTSLQTKQQLAIQSLSIANQQPQSLLSLFK